MQKFFYAADAYLPTYEQGADLIMVKTASGELWGVACEFDLCTQDIEQAVVRCNDPFDATDPKFAQARWTGYEDRIGMTPASWADLTHAGLADFIAGYQLESELGIHRFPQR